MDVLRKVLVNGLPDYRRSVNTPDFPAQDWYHNPDLSAVVSVPMKYWVLGDRIVTGKPINEDFS